MPPEHAASLTRAASPNNLAVFAQYLGVMGAVEDGIVECFRRGGGLPYEAYHRFHEVMAEDSGETVVAALESRSGVVRDLAQQQLAWRQDRSATPALERLAASASLPESRAQALWSLHSIGALSPAVVARALQDAHAGVRQQAQ